MYSRELKRGYFLVEGLNSFSTTIYFYYFYFFAREVHGFGNKANLLLAASTGLVYALFSAVGGKAGQRYGYITAVKLGLGTMIIALVISGLSSSVYAHVGLLVVMNAGVCFTWPALEALVTTRESRKGVQHMVGVYNVVWAATGAIGYFLGGALLHGLGFRSLFFVPLSIIVVQFALIMWLEKKARTGAAGEATGAQISDIQEVHPHPEWETRAFVRMAWLANPFAYVAINTLLAVMPGISERLGLSTMVAGFCCSIWCFARLGAFGLLWVWEGWHYKFRWLFLAFSALAASFGLMLLWPNLVVLILAQLAFGLALGLIYYSSLFYSMDSSQTKGEHGGIHEAAIGLGNFAGPAVGAASLYLLPQQTGSAGIAVTGLLSVGLGGLLVMWKRRK